MMSRSDILKSDSMIDTWHIRAKTDATLRVDAIIRFIRDTPPR